MQQHQGLNPVIFYVLELVFFIFKKSVQKCAVFQKKFVKKQGDGGLRIIKVTARHSNKSNALKRTACRVMRAHKKGKVTAITLLAVTDNVTERY